MADRPLYDAPSMESIGGGLLDRLGFPPQGSGDGNAMAEDFLSSPVLEEADPRIPPGSTSKLVGLLFCRPASKFGAEIVKDMGYFHLRSGAYVDVYCAGYGAAWPPGHHADQKAVATVAGIEWFFSERAFVALLAEIESRTRWQYSGETELVLLAARGNLRKMQGALDFRDVIACNLEAMQKDGAISSSAAFFEVLFRFGASHDYQENPLWTLSDELGISQGKGFILELLLRLVPEQARKLYKSARHFAVRDITKTK